MMCMLLTVHGDRSLFTKARTSYIFFNGEVTNLINNKTDQ